jgi:putative endonuclease
MLIYYFAITKPPAMWNYNFYVYILTNRDKKVLYIGVTNDLTGRLYEHWEGKGTGSSFTSKYHCYYQVRYEHFSHIEHAIKREKELKKWRREKKNELISSEIPDWLFLNEQVNND